MKSCKYSINFAERAYLLVVQVGARQFFCVHGEALKVADMQLGQFTQTGNMIYTEEGMEAQAPSVHFKGRSERKASTVKKTLKDITFSTSNRCR